MTDRVVARPGRPTDRQTGGRTVPLETDAENYLYTWGYYQVQYPWQCLCVKGTAPERVAAKDTVDYQGLSQFDRSSWRR
jgi:hypothetical protein